MDFYDLAILNGARACRKEAPITMEEAAVDTSGLAEALGIVGYGDAIYEAALAEGARKCSELKE